MNKFEPGERVRIVFYTHIPKMGTIVAVSPTNMGNNYYVKYDNSKEIRDVSSSWLEKLTPLEELL